MKDLNVESVKSVLERIRSVNSKNKKAEILKEFQDNKIVRETLRFLLNDFVVTGLAMKKIEKEIGVEPNFSINTLQEAFSYLKKNNTGSDVNIANIRAFIEAQDEENHDFLKKLFTKTYRCGLASKSLNNVFSNEVPEFSCQLAESYAKYQNKVKGVFTLTTKLDGHRTIALVDNFGQAVFFTRKGTPIEGLNQIASDISSLSNERGILGMTNYNKGFVLDGEVVIENVENKEKTFQETSKVIRKNGVKTGLVFHVFDIIPYDEFTKGESSLNYQARREHLERVFNKEQYKYVELVKSLYTGKDESVISEVLKTQVDNGEEGIMINTDMPYKNKRNTGLLKVKNFVSDDLLVVGIYSGNKSTRLEKSLGGVYVDYKGTKVGVGSGFSDEEREEFYNNPELIVGKMIEVKYFEETENQKNTGASLRFPIYIGIREDKTKEDVSYES